MAPWLTAPSALITRADVANGSSLAKAIDYSLRRWEALSRYAVSAHLPIDNNPIENAIRPIALGKKIGCSPGASAPDNALRRFRVCLQPRRRTISTLPPGSPMCSGNFPRGRTVGSMNCCRLQGIASVNALSAMSRWGGWTLTRQILFWQV